MPDTPVNTQAESKTVRGSVRTSGQPRNLNLQILRAIAATMVVVYHAGHFTALKTNAPWLGELFGPRLGFYGVLMFFVLSGYLMVGAIRRYTPGTFLAHRLVRLFPTYWSLVAILLLVQYFRTDTFPGVPWEALTLLPLGAMHRPLGVEWTLLYEVFFYLVCTSLCFVRRGHATFFMIWTILVLLAAFVFAQFGTTFQPTILQIPFSLWNLGFLGGAFLGMYRSRLGWLKPEVCLILAGPTVLLGELVHSGPRILFAVLALCLITQAAVSVASTKSRTTRMGTAACALVLVGEYSYGLYLAHGMSIRIALQYIDPGAHAPVSIFAGMLGVGMAVGLAAGKLDYELYQRLKKAADRALARARKTRKLGIATPSTNPPPKL